MEEQGEGRSHNREGPGGVIDITPELFKNIPIECFGVVHHVLVTFKGQLLKRLLRIRIPPTKRVGTVGTCIGTPNKRVGTVGTAQSKEK